MFIVHPFEAFCGSDPKILILGSFPSVKSRENNFFYGHPQNRFWKVISSVGNMPEPKTVDEKKAMLNKMGIALWDSIHSCKITGSSDSSIKNVTPNDIRPIVEKYGICAVFANGYLACLAFEGNVYLVYVKLAFCIAECAKDSSPVCIGTEHCCLGEI